MSTFDLLPVVFVGATALLAALVAMRAGITHGRGGKVTAFFALFLLPALSLWAGYSSQMEHATSTKFCLSCHVMEDFGRSLYVDDPSYLPAAHFQNNRVDRDHACYTCHTDYTMFGTLHSKLRGVRHMYVQYLGTIPAPDRIRLYTPFNNRECLHCHDGARKFEGQSAHNKTPTTLADIKSNHLSCVASKCHDTVHDVGTLSDATFWKGGR
jgi:cytochrome c-type protein NapC